MTAKHLHVVLSYVITTVSFCFILGSCSSEDTSKSEDIETPQEIAVEQEPIISYPIKTTQRNLREMYVGGTGVYPKYDSIEITQINDSSYFFHYFRNGKPTRLDTDTLVIPHQINELQDTIQNTDSLKIPDHTYFPHSRNSETLYAVEIEGKTYKVIESGGSCHSFWQPMGHIHRGSLSYFSLDFGILGTFQMSGSSTSKTLWLGDWDQELVDQIIETLPLANEQPYFNLDLR